MPTYAPLSIVVSDEGSTQQRQWTIEALEYWTAVTRLQTPNSDVDLDRFLWNQVVRRQDRHHARDVLISWHANPSPKVKNEFAYTDLDDDVYQVRIWDQLDNASRPPPYSGERFFKETVWHEMGHVVIGLLMEAFGAGYVRGEILALFGGSWNSGPWKNQALEAACETFKDWCFPQRQFNNRTNLQLRGGRSWERFGDLMMSKPMRPRGPLGRIDVDGYTSGYTGPTDRVPMPAPVFDYGQRYRVRYDMPARLPFGGVEGINLGSFDRVGAQWVWGGRGAGVPDARNYQRPGPASFARYRTPPPAGSVVRFRVRWDRPDGPMPQGRHLDWANHNAQLPAGVVAIDTGGVDYLIPKANVESGGVSLVDAGDDWRVSYALFAQLIEGIVWCAGSHGAEVWDTVTIPRELQHVTWTEKQLAKGGGGARMTDIGRYAPVYLDFRGGGTWDLALAVPAHSGELAMQISWRSANRNGDIYPNRFYPSNVPWTVYPEPTIIDRDFPQGAIVAGNAPAAFVPNRKLRDQHRVVGSVTAAVEVVES